MDAYNLHIFFRELHHLIILLIQWKNQKSLPYNYIYGIRKYFTIYPTKIFTQNKIVLLLKVKYERNYKVTYLRIKHVFLIEN